MVHKKGLLILPELSFGEWIPTDRFYLQTVMYGTLLLYSLPSEHEGTTKIINATVTYSMYQFVCQFVCVRETFFWNSVLHLHLYMWQSKEKYKQEEKIIYFRVVVCVASLTPPTTVDHDANQFISKSIA